MNIIMVAVGEPLAVRARILAKVAQLARSFDVAVEFVHCAFESRPGAAREAGSVSSDAEIRKIIEGRRHQLHALAEHLRRVGIRASVTVRWDCPSYEGIIREVSRQEPDLLIAQSTRHARLSRLMLTQTDYKLIEACPCPLLLMKNERPYTAPCIVAAVDPMHAHAKPAALDQAIMANAGMLAERLHGRLHVVHASAPWPRVMEASPELRRLPQPVWAEACAAYEEKAAARVKELARQQNVSDDCIHLVWGDASEQLPTFSATVSAVIVVMGAVSRSGLRRVFIGHTAERVLDALSCDVLIVKPPGFDSPISRRSSSVRSRRGARAAGRSSN